MYNNQKRVELVKRRIYERNCQQQRHGIYGLSAACMVLFAFLAGMLHVVAGHTQMAAQGMYGSVLLYKDAGSYVLVSVVSFILYQIAGQRTWDKGAERKEHITGKGGQKRWKVK